MTRRQFFLDFVRSRVFLGSHIVLFFFGIAYLIERHLHAIRRFYPRIAISKGHAMLGVRVPLHQPHAGPKLLLPHLEPARLDEPGH